MKKFKNLSKRALALVVSVMMCMGILQVNALAAVTVEAKALCDLEEHTHVDECYRTCKFDEGDEEEKQVPHVHTDACYVAGDPVLNCTRTEADMDEVTVSHEHTDACYDGNGELICNLEEGSEETKQVPHVHTEACYAAGDPVLNCGLTEADMDVVTVSHVHTDDCYVSEAQCGLEEHTHDASCGYSADNVYKELYEKLNSKLDEDKDVVLILNGTTLDMSKYTDNNIRVTLEDKTLTIQDGNVAGGTIQGNGKCRVITVLNGGTLTLSGSTKITNGGTSGGAGVLVSGENSSFTMEGGEISGNKTASTGGGVTVEKGATFEMSGGTISGNTTTSTGGGVYVDNGTFTMTGGTISGNTAGTGVTTDGGKGIWVDEGSWNVHPEGQGGGVYVTNGGTFTMTEGENSTPTISGNYAGEGGGIFIAGTSNYKGEWQDTSKFEMTGGTVDGNVATLGEGGGIYIQGTGTITKGKIINNETHTTADLGGGGIYIESNGGKLNLKNAIITNNTAEGLGGGLAACVHGQTVVLVENGALIYDNENHGDDKSHSQGHTVKGQNNGNKIDGYDLWANNEKFKEAAKDIFTASDGEQGGLVIVSNKGLYDTNSQWTGWVFAYKDKELLLDGEGQPLFALVTTDADGNLVVGGTYDDENNLVGGEYEAAVKSDRLLGLTSGLKPTDDAVKAAMEMVQASGVIISGNSSATHGGGIANNGLLIIGEGDIEDTYGKQDLDLKKEYTNTKTDTKIDLEKNQFSFTVTLVDAPEDVTMTPLVGYNDESGNVQFNFPEGTFTAAGTYQFLVEEQDGGESGVTYDTTKYLVEIKVEKDYDETTVDGIDGPIVIKLLTVGDPVIYKVVLGEDGNPVRDEYGNLQRVQKVDEAGNPVFDDGKPVYVTVDGITFNNTYTPSETSDDPLGSLTITKAVVGGGDAVADKEYSFTITSDVKDFEEQHFTLKAGGSKKFFNLEKGTYTVTEDDASVEGYTWTVSGTGVVDMTEGGDATVTVTNTYTEEEPEKGSLTITKAVVGGGDAVADKEYTFTVTSDVEGFAEQSFALKAGETKTISELDAGMYTVTEDDASVEGYTWTVSGVGGVEVAAGGSADVTVTNTYTELEPEKGSLTITKAVVGGGAAAANKEYTFTVAGPDGYSEAVSIVGSGSAALTGLEPGAYTVTEDSAEISGYTWTVSGAGEVTVTAGASANVTVTNTYSEIPEEPTPEIPNNPEEPTPTPTPEPPTPEPEIPVVPEVEVPDEPTPLEDLPELPVVSDDTIVETPEEPVVDLDDTPVPLSEPLVTEPEPEAEILEELPEDPVPLSDIPATGDISLLWYLTVAFSAAGLLILKVLGKKHEEEQA